MYVTDAAAAPLSLTQFYVMQELAAMYPDHKPFETCDRGRLSMFDKVTGSKNIRRLFGRRYRVDDIAPYWDKDAAAFKEKSSKYYLYK